MTKEEIEGAQELIRGQINWAASMGFEAPPRGTTADAHNALDALCEAARHEHPGRQAALEELAKAILHDERIPWPVEVEDAIHKLRPLEEK